MEIICRICRNARRKKLIPLLKNDPNSNEFEIETEGEKFEYCLGLKVAEIQNYSVICTTCEQKLNDFYIFKQQAVKSHNELLAITLEKNTLNNDEIEGKYESFSDEDHLDNIEDDEEPLILETMTDSDHEILNNSCTQEIGFENMKIEIIDEPTILQNTLKPVENISQMYCNDELQEEENLSRELKNSQEKEIKSKKTEDNNDCLEYITISSEKIKNELSVKSTKTKTYKCDICDKKFANKQFVEGHMNEHKGLPAYLCNICGKTFKFKCRRYYNYHMKDHQGLPRPYLCKLCPKSYHTKKDFGVHLRGHKNERPFVCERCGSGFITMSHLKRHLDSHSEYNNYKCDICDKGFRTKNTMHTHRKEMHFPKPFNCKICNKEFTRNCYYQNHIKRYHRDLEGEEYSDFCFNLSDNNTLKSHQSKTHLPKPKCFNCVKCGKMFHQKQSLQKHFPNCEIPKIKLEETETPCECMTCGKTFKSINNYINHLKSDHNLECDICHKRYRAKHTLRTHLKELHLPKRFSCDRCDIKFGRKQYYEMHVKKHHPHLLDELFPKIKPKENSECSEFETLPEEASTIMHTHWT